MATLYSKKSFITLVLGMLMTSVSYGQAAPKKPVSLKLDSKGQAYYEDVDGDKITVLDYKTRKVLQAVTNYKKQDQNISTMSPKTFYKESVPDKFDDPKPEFRTYTIEEGDTWEGVSKKLYDTDTHWAQLKLWNEELLKDPKLPAGAEIKYLDLPKK